MSFFGYSRPLVFAHRGGCALGPENTLAAFDLGMAAGADGLELDVHLAADGVPVVHHDAPFPDAATNPVTAPIHTFHVGLWFGTPEAAGAGGCPNTQTPFNGDHTAGIEVLSTRNFTGSGPLRNLAP